MLSATTAQTQTYSSATSEKNDSLEEFLNEKLDSLIDDLVSKVNIKLKDLGLGEHALLFESVSFMSQEFDEMQLRQEDLLASIKSCWHEMKHSKKE